MTTTLSFNIAYLLVSMMKKKKLEQSRMIFKAKLTNLQAHPIFLRHSAENVAAWLCCLNNLVMSGLYSLYE
jgi:hypothetical protein